jgi:hypothetical protein
MASVIEAAFTFFIIVIGGFIALSILTNTNHVNIGSCTWNGTDTVNCSLSNSEYQLYNSTATQYGSIFTAISPLAWVLVMAIVIAIFLQIAGWVR